MNPRRTFIARVNGVEYEIPTTMSILRAAEEVSGASLIEALAENKLAAIMQGAIYAGLRAQGISVIGDGDDAVPLTFEAIGELCDFAETRDNYIAFVTALAPETSNSDSDLKNAHTGGSARRSRGSKSSDTPTGPSS